MSKWNSEIILLRLHKGGRRPQLALPTAMYKRLLGEVDPRLASSRRFISKELALTDDLSRHARETAKFLRRRPNPVRQILVLEFLEQDADLYAYDDLCGIAFAAMANEKSNVPWCILISISDGGIFKESEFLRRQLQPFCNQRSILLILVSSRNGTTTEFLCPGRLAKVPEVVQLKQERLNAETGAVQPADRSPDDIEMAFDILFGHFEIEYDGNTYHVPAIASASQLSRDKVFLQQFNRRLLAELGTVNYQVLAIGLLDGGIDELSLKLIEGDMARFVNADFSNLVTGPVAVLCDFIMSAYPLPKICSELRKRGVTKLVIVGIGQYADAPQVRDVKMMSFVQTRYKATNTTNECPFCKQGVPLIAGGTYGAFARNLSDFDDFTFWELIRENPDYYIAGHWRSPRTPNHYQFRIRVAPMLKRHSHGLAVRIRNLLQSRSILPDWIDKILCAKGEESEILAQSVANVIGLSAQDVIAIPREQFASVAGPDVSDGLWDFLKNKYRMDKLRHRNFIIVDQAAHHFRTLAALRTVCEHLDSKILAFAVILNRIVPALDLGDYLHDSHYICLYSWPSPPRLSHECPCVDLH